MLLSGLFALRQSAARCSNPTTWILPRCATSSAGEYHAEARGKLGARAGMQHYMARALDVVLRARAVTSRSRAIFGGAAFCRMDVPRALVVVLYSGKGAHDDPT